MCCCGWFTLLFSPTPTKEQRGPASHPLSPSLQEYLDLFELEEFDFSEAERVVEATESRYQVRI